MSIETGDEINIFISGKTWTTIQISCCQRGKELPFYTSSYTQLPLIPIETSPWQMN
jgi:hypothetical protein